MILLNIAIFTGIGCGPLIGGIFTDLWGMASVFYVMAELSLLALLMILLQHPFGRLVDRPYPVPQ